MRRARKTAGQPRKSISVIALSLYAGCVSERYPEHLMEFAPNYDGDIPESWQRFFDLREQLLLDYGYNTARAYWADLQDWFEWAIGRNKNVLALTRRTRRSTTHSYDGGSTARQRSGEGAPPIG